MGYIYNEELGYRLEKGKEKNHQIKKKIHRKGVREGKQRGVSQMICKIKLN